MAKKNNDAVTVGPTEGITYQVGDRVEVYCDHTRDDDRVRDWLEGVVVQKEEKRVAVQFVQDVYLTNGWMVPDRVLWLAHTSENIRPASKSKRRSRSKGK
jgi:hypothetical protein